MQITLVACASKKRSEPQQAQHLYISNWFLKASNYAKRTADRWYILSARHGLLEPTQVIAPYDESLNAMPAAARRAWAVWVLDSLGGVVGPGDQVTILAGRRYREHLVGPLLAMCAGVCVPLAGLGIGQQSRWLKEQLKQIERKGHNR
jgi:hypothetical protein